MTDQDDEGDPLLVRPYILGEAGDDTAPASEATWPETAPDADPDATAIVPTVPAGTAARPGDPIPAPGDPRETPVDPLTAPGDPRAAMDGPGAARGGPDTARGGPGAALGGSGAALGGPLTAPGRSRAAPGRGRQGWRRVALLAALAVLVLAGAGTLVLAFRQEPATPHALPADLPLPSAPAAAPSAAPATVPANPTTTTALPRTSPTSTPATTGTATIAPTTAAAPTSPAAKPPTTSPAPAALVPPAADRTGLIRGLNGLCLDLNGGVAVDDNHVQVYDCNGSGAQIWTLAADGTLRVLGRCALVAGDTTVHIVGCDGRTPAQWRSGPDGTLVNAATGGCLTDPSGGGRSGTGVRVDGCNGDRAQRWDLP